MTATPPSTSSRFQSTLPVGGATRNRTLVYVRTIISIHAPRGGSDGRLAIASCAYTYFNPRSPWGERQRSVKYHMNIDDFNPRSPWGERLWFRPHRSRITGFQSTLPVGGAT